MIYFFFILLLFKSSYGSNYSYESTNLIPDENFDINYSFVRNTSNHNLCLESCSNNFNCIGFINDNLSCKGIKNYSNLILSENTTFYEKKYCLNMCDSRLFLFNTYNDRCFCDNHLLILVIVV